jgi:Zn-dependent peptidase ImmA (M78 family)
MRNRVQKMSSVDRLKAIHRAKEIVDILNIERASHIDIEAIAMHRGAIVTEGPLKGADGRLAVVKDEALITVRESIKEKSKKRFVMAHEIGHYEMHRGEAFTKSCTESDFYNWTKGNPLEIEANYFASELLMPEELFNKIIEGHDISLALIKQLSNEFKTSWTAAAIRFVTLRPEYALICSEQSIIKWFVVNSEYFPYFINTEGKVHPESLAYDYFQGERVSTKLMRVAPMAWLNETSIKRTMKELVISLGSYNQALSIIYIEEWDDY